jgi:hypothetical protein
MRVGMAELEMLVEVLAEERPIMPLRALRRVGLVQHRGACSEDIPFTLQRADEASQVHKPFLEQTASVAQVVDGVRLAEGLVGTLLLARILVVKRGMAMMVSR